MNRGIVHNQDRLWRGKPSAIRQELSYEVFKDNGVCRALEDLCEHGTILSVGRQDLIAISALEVCHLHRSSPAGRPTRTSKTYTLVTNRLVYVDKVIRRELRQPPEMEVSQVRIPLLSYTTSLFPRPADREQRPSNSVFRNISTKLSHQVFRHLILI
jgi:hypothetical protein